MKCEQTSRAGVTTGLKQTVLDNAISRASRSGREGHAPHPMRFLRWLVVLILAAATLYGARAESAFEMVSRGTRLSNTAFPLWTRNAEGVLVLDAVVRVGQFYLDYERKGFFRIALLPVAKLEGVVVQVPDANTATNGFANLERWLSPTGAGRVELRDLKLTVGTSTNLLEAGRVRPGANGEWTLSEGVTVAVGTNRVQAASGVVHLTGERAGELVLATTPPLHQFLFATNVSVCLTK